MKKRVHIFPHTMLLLGGRLLLISYNAVLPYLWWLFIDDYNNSALEENIADLILLIPLTIVFGIGVLYICHYLWHHCFGEIIVTEKEVIYFGLFLPIIRLKFENIKYVDIRTFDEGNIMYSKGMRRYKNANIDLYKFILLSENPLPAKRIDKVRPSRKNKLIKYSVNKKLCEALVDKLPEMQSRIVDYQLYLYKKCERR